MTRDPDPLRDPRFADLLSRLRVQKGPEPSPGFVANTMARLRRPSSARWLAPALGWGAAAALALWICASGWWNDQPDLVRQDPPASSPVEILMAAQRADGGWSADAQNLRPRYDTGVTALALLALVHADPAALEGSKALSIRAGIAHLLRQQGADGRFGGDFSGAIFVNYLSTMALQAAAHLPNADSSWSAAAERASVQLPPDIQMAKLNNHLAHPLAFPSRWAEAGGSTVRTAIQMLQK